MSVTNAVDSVRATHLTNAECVREVAVHLYQQQRLTLGQASGLAQMPQARFQHLLACRDIAIHYDEADFTEDLETLRALTR